MKRTGLLAICLILCLLLGMGSAFAEPNAHIFVEKNETKLRLIKDFDAGEQLYVALFAKAPNADIWIETDFWQTEYGPRFNKRCFIYAENCRDIDFDSVEEYVSKLMSICGIDY